MCLFIVVSCCEDCIPFGLLLHRNMHIYFNTQGHTQKEKSKSYETNLETNYSWHKEICILKYFPCLQTIALLVCLKYDLVYTIQIDFIFFECKLIEAGYILVCVYERTRYNIFYYS